MSKEDWIWVAIRIFGIYLLVLAITAAPSLFSDAFSTYARWRLWGTAQRLTESLAQSVPDKKEAASPLVELGSESFINSLSKCVGTLLRVILLGAVGIYVIRSGRLIRRWVFPPEQPSPESPQ